MGAQYATTDDAEEMYGIDFLLRVASVKGDSQKIDIDKFERNLVSASGRIDAYLGHRYDLPLPQVPDHLVEKCVDIAIYRMCATAAQLTEIIKDRYEDAIMHLKDIAAGKSSLGISLSEEESEGGADNADQEQNKTFFAARLVRY